MVMGSLGSKSGLVAMARMAPVFTSITMTTPRSETLFTLTEFSRYFSAMAWISASRVRMRLSPSLAS